MDVGVFSSFSQIGLVFLVFVGISTVSGSVSVLILWVLMFLAFFFIIGILGLSLVFLQPPWVLWSVSVLIFWMLVFLTVYSGLDLRIWYLLTFLYNLLESCSSPYFVLCSGGFLWFLRCYFSDFGNFLSDELIEYSDILWFSFKGFVDFSVLSSPNLVFFPAFSHLYCIDINTLEVSITISSLLKLTDLFNNRKN